ncbi:MAG: DNA repair protein RadC [Bacteroidales bacterium]|nr:DNA repair protein RadC [Bacteroidales bacterium]
MKEYDLTPSGGIRLMRETDLDLRPREKAMAHGFDSLTDAELMAIIFGTGTLGKGVVALCEEMLEQNGGHLSLLAKRTVGDLVNRFKGVGQVKAITLLAALRLGARAAKDAKSLAEKKVIRTAKDSYDWMRHHFEWNDHEQFWAMFLNRGGKVIHEERFSIGTTNYTPVDVKLVVRSALECMANSMVIFHNHPSGQMRPSKEDDDITDKLYEAAMLFDIRVNDHLIITDAGYFSYAEHGKL